MKKSKDVLNQVSKVLTLLFFLYGLAVLPVSAQPAYFSDDFESGLGNWIVSGYDWDVTTFESRSGSYAATESPGENYGSNLDVDMTMLNSIDLSSATSPVVTFWHKVDIPETGDRLRFSEAGLPDLLEIRSAGHRVAFFDMDKLAFPLTVRNFLPGDRFTPFGMKGTKKVKKYFSDSGVPADRRRRCPLVISEGEIIWVAGFRIGASAQVDDATRRVVKAELFLA